MNSSAILWELQHGAQPTVDPEVEAAVAVRLLATLEARHRRAIDAQWAYAEFLERILEDEIEGPAQKQLTLWVRRAAGRNVRSCSGFVDFLEHP